MLWIDFRSHERTLRYHPSMNQQNLWAPWRLAYLRELDRRAEDAAGSSGGRDAAVNFLADYWATPDQDAANHVLHRDAHGMVLLNRYPYANGHLLVALGQPKPRLMDYHAQQRAAFWRLVDFAMTLADQTLSPQGINMGINEGRAAGAGVPGHLHAHVVPRWNGDTNFITVVGEVRVVPEALESMAARYRPIAQQLARTL